MKNANNEATFALGHVLTLGRRKLLASAVKLALANLIAGHVSPAWAEETDRDNLLESDTGKSWVKGHRVALKLPEIVENGHRVPVSFFVESPMTDNDYVESVTILAERNPRPGVAKFDFSPCSGEARASTHIRLWTSQTVYAVAKMSDGTFLTGQKRVIVIPGERPAL